MRKYILPNSLKPNDLISITAPSEPLNPKRLGKLNSGINILKKMGFRIHVGGSVNKSFFYMAGKAVDRIKELNEMFANPEIKAILTAWGGKSSNQIIEHLDYDLIIRNPKIFSGFSDTTNIANAIFAMTGVVTMHGPNVVGKLSENTEGSMEQFKEAVLSGSPYTVKSENAKVIKHGNANGILMGGNLTCFSLGLIGTNYLGGLDNESIIFFWEAGSRNAREIDQFLTHLKLTGFLNKVCGMVVGYLYGTKKDDGWGNRDIADVIISASEGYSFPIVQIPVFGHGELFNPVIPIGGKGELTSEPLQLKISNYLNKCI